MVVTGSPVRAIFVNHPVNSKPVRVGVGSVIVGVWTVKVVGGVTKLPPLLLKVMV
jgi:hypothetical protein